MILCELSKDQEIGLIFINFYIILTIVNIYTYIKDRKDKKLSVDGVEVLFRLVPINLFINAWRKLATKN